MNLYSGIMTPSLGGGISNFSASATASVGGSGGSLLGGSMERLRLAQSSQFPFLSGSEPYPFEGNFEPSDFMTQMRPKPPSPSPFTQVAPVKMEDNNNPNNNNPELHFSRQFLGMMNPPGNDHQFQWNNTATAWTDLSGFSSSSTSNNPP